MWRIINEEKLNQVDFFKAVLEEMLDRKEVNLNIIYGIAQELEKTYEEAISYFYDEMENNYLNGILKAIKNSLNFLNERIKKWTFVISDLNGR